MARTKNRETNTAVSPFPYNTICLKLGEYIRLSKEDMNRDKDESNSVVNKKQVLDMEAYCRDTRQLIEWEGGGRNNAEVAEFYGRLKFWNVKSFFSNNWNAHSDLIPSESLLQQKHRCIRPLAKLFIVIQNRKYWQ